MSNYGSFTDDMFHAIEMLVRFGDGCGKGKNNAGPSNITSKPKEREVGGCNVRPVENSTEFVVSCNGAIIKDQVPWDKLSLNSMKTM